MDAEYLTRNELINRGWNKKLIEKYLTPALKTINPHRKNALLNLYSVKEIEEVEHSGDYMKETDKKSCGKKREASIKWANQARINITTSISVMVLAESLGTEDGREILSEIRHKFTNYLKLMQQCDERYAPLEAKRVIRLRLLIAICKCYNSLRPGATRQWEKWYPNSSTMF